MARTKVTKAEAVKAGQRAAQFAAKRVQPGGIAGGIKSVAKKLFGKKVKKPRGVAVKNIKAREARRTGNFLKASAINKSPDAGRRMAKQGDEMRLKSRRLKK
jgi:hypothetical protein